MNDTVRLAAKALELLELTNIAEACEGDVTPRGNSVDVAR
jgi:hypothetical protein